MIQRAGGSSQRSRERGTAAKSCRAASRRISPTAHTKFTLSDDDLLPRSCVAWHPDGNHVITASGDYTLRVWKIRMPDGSIATDPEPLRTMYGHRGWVTSCAYNSLADRIATTSTDKSVIIWDPVTHQAMDRMFFKDWAEDCIYVPRKYTSDELLVVGHFVDVRLALFSSSHRRFPRRQLLEAAQPTHCVMLSQGHAYDVSSTPAKKVHMLPRASRGVADSLWRLWSRIELARVFLSIMPEAAMLSAPRPLRSADCTWKARNSLSQGVRLSGDCLG